MNLLREFDLTYWRMMEALGYPIPDRIDRRFPRKLVGNCGVNPFECGKCSARKLFPRVNLTAEIIAFLDAADADPRQSQLHAMQHGMIAALKRISEETP